MKKRTKSKSPNVVELREVPTRIMKDVLDYMVAEVGSCDLDGIVPAMRPGFVALALTCARELRRRGKSVCIDWTSPPNCPVHEQEKKT